MPVIGQYQPFLGPRLKMKNQPRTSKFAAKLSSESTPQPNLPTSDKNTPHMLI